MKTIKEILGYTRGIYEYAFEILYIRLAEIELMLEKELDPKDRINLNKKRISLLATLKLIKDEHNRI